MSFSLEYILSSRRTNGISHSAHILDPLGPFLEHLLKIGLALVGLELSLHLLVVPLPPLQRPVQLTLCQNIDSTAAKTLNFNIISSPRQVKE